LMGHFFRRSRKWRLISLCRWDRASAPIYEASSRGGGIPLLKTLLTNHCVNECRYCGVRAGSLGGERWRPDKLALVAYTLWKDGLIKGVFLSSAMEGDPDDVVERELMVVEELRSMGYTGYVHLRLMPGVSRSLIREAIKLVDRVGVNLEAPRSDIFSEICPDKGDFEQDVFRRLEWMVEEARRGGLRCGVDTQFVVGAVEDDDLSYLKMVEDLYRDLGLRRVYFSGFEPVPGTPLEKRPPCRPSREYRLYQASFLIRDYGFTSNQLSEILDDNGMLPNMDPKLAYARRHRELFPVNLNECSYMELLKVPHVGPSTAKKIIAYRSRRSFKTFRDVEQAVGRRVARLIARYVEPSRRGLEKFG